MCSSLFLWADKTYVSVTLETEATSRIFRVSFFFFFFLTCGVLVLGNLSAVSKHWSRAAILTELLEAHTDTQGKPLTATIAAQLPPGSDD